RNPYTTYRSYDTSWEMAMPYGPGLWGPFVLAQWLRLDLRVVTIVGELFVPAWCGAAAAVEAFRGRLSAAGSWLSVLGALVSALGLDGPVVSANHEGRGLAGARQAWCGNDWGHGMAPRVAPGIACNAGASHRDDCDVRCRVGRISPRPWATTLDGARAFCVQHDDALSGALFVLRRVAAARL